MSKIYVAFDSSGFSGAEPTEHDVLEAYRELEIANENARTDKYDDFSETDSIPEKYHSDVDEDGDYVYDHYDFSDELASHQNYEDRHHARAAVLKPPNAVGFPRAAILVTCYIAILMNLGFTSKALEPRDIAMDLLSVNRTNGQYNGSYRTAFSSAVFRYLCHKLKLYPIRRSIVCHDSIPLPRLGYGYWNAMDTLYPKTIQITKNGITRKIKVLTKSEVGGNLTITFSQLRAHFSDVALTLRLHCDNQKVHSASLTRTTCLYYDARATLHPKYLLSYSVTAFKKWFEYAPVIANNCISAKLCQIHKINQAVSLDEFKKRFRAAMIGWTLDEQFMGLCRGKRFSSNIKSSYHITDGIRGFINISIVTSQLNGNNGEWTNGDDVRRNGPQRVGFPSNFDYLFCACCGRFGRVSSLVGVEGRRYGASLCIPCIRDTLALHGCATNVSVNTLRVVRGLIAVPYDSADQRRVSRGIIARIQHLFSNPYWSCTRDMGRRIGNLTGFSETMVGLAGMRDIEDAVDRNSVTEYCLFCSDPDRVVSNQVFNVIRICSWCTDDRNEILATDHRVSSSLNGSNGEWTNCDDVRTHFHKIPKPASDQKKMPDGAIKRMADKAKCKPCLPMDQLVKCDLVGCHGGTDAVYHRSNDNKSMGVVCELTEESCAHIKERVSKNDTSPGDVKLRCGVVIKEEDMGDIENMKGVKSSFLAEIKPSGRDSKEHFDKFTCILAPSGEIDNTKLYTYSQRVITKNTLFDLGKHSSTCIRIIATIYRLYCETRDDCIADRMLECLKEIYVHISSVMTEEALDDEDRDNLVDSFFDEAQRHIALLDIPEMVQSTLGEFLHVSVLGRLPVSCLSYMTRSAFSGPAVPKSDNKPLANTKQQSISNAPASAEETVEMVKSVVTAVENEQGSRIPEDAKQQSISIAPASAEETVESGTSVVSDVENKENVQEVGYAPASGGDAVVGTEAGNVTQPISKRKLVKAKPDLDCVVDAQDDAVEDEKDDQSSVTSSASIASECAEYISQCLLEIGSSVNNNFLSLCKSISCNNCQYLANISDDDVPREIPSFSNLDIRYKEYVRDNANEGHVFAMIYHFHQAYTIRENKCQIVDLHYHFFVERSMILKKHHRAIYNETCEIISRYVSQSATEFVFSDITLIHDKLLSSVKNVSKWDLAKSDTFCDAKTDGKNPSALPNAVNKKSTDEHTQPSVDIKDKPVEDPPAPPKVANKKIPDEHIRLVKLYTARSGGRNINEDKRNFVDKLMGRGTTSGLSNLGYSYTTTCNATSSDSDSVILRQNRLGKRSWLGFGAYVLTAGSYNKTKYAIGGEDTYINYKNCYDEVCDGYILVGLEKYLYDEIVVSSYGLSPDGSLIAWISGKMQSMVPAYFASYKAKNHAEHPCSSPEHYELIYNTVVYMVNLLLKGSERLQGAVATGSSSRKQTPKIGDMMRSMADVLDRR